MQSTDPSYSVPPFPAFPSTSRYIPLGSVQSALGRVCRSIDAREAVSLVIGPPGTGKSLICGLLVQHYRASHEVVVLGETPLENRAAFLRHLLHHLGADLSKVPDGDLQLALIDRVCGKDAAEGGLLIVVDEAQSLSSDVIESIRMVTNIMREGEPRVFAVLCGGVKLDEILVEASMESFTQRVATRCYLHPMNGEETRRYVTETIRNCGAEPEGTITNEAISAVHHACSGVPRLINQMLTQAIDCAEEAGQPQITEKIIDRAWAQLQQLPGPMVDEPKIRRDMSPIEFGELEEAVEFGDPIQKKKTSFINVSEQQTDCASVASEPSRHESAESSRNEAGGGEIFVEQSTAQWIDEPFVEAPAAPAVSAAELFGEFEYEEKLDLGNGVLLPPRSAASTPPPTDLESMLHQEIIGISSFDESNFVATPVDERPGPSGPAAIVDEQERMDDQAGPGEIVEEPQERVEEFITVGDEEAARRKQKDPGPVLWISDMTGEEENRGNLNVVRDDSDILVIEDEVELRRVDAARLDAKDKTISVDFQAMLTRMRSGT